MSVRFYGFFQLAYRGDSTLQNFPKTYQKLLDRRRFCVLRVMPLFLLILHFLTQILECFTPFHSANLSKSKHPLIVIYPMSNLSKGFTIWTNHIVVVCFPFTLIKFSVYSHNGSVYPKMVLCIQITVLCIHRRTICKRRRTICKQRRIICKQRRIICKRRRTICNRKTVLCKRRRTICNRNTVLCKRRRTICNRNTVLYKRRRTICNRNTVLCKQRMVLRITGSPISTLITFFNFWFFILRPKFPFQLPKFHF